MNIGFDSVGILGPQARIVELEITRRASFLKMAEIDKEKPVFLF